MGRLTTHVLDTAHGRPGGGIAVTVYRLGAGDVITGGTDRGTRIAGSAPDPGGTGISSGHVVRTACAARLPASRVHG